MVKFWLVLGVLLIKVLRSLSLVCSVCPFACVVVLTFFCSFGFCFVFCPCCLSDLLDGVLTRFPTKKIDLTCKSCFQIIRKEFWTTNEFYFLRLKSFVSIICIITEFAKSTPPAFGVWGKTKWNFNKTIVSKRNLLGFEKNVWRQSGTNTSGKAPCSRKLCSKDFLCKRGKVLTKAEQKYKKLDNVSSWGNSPGSLTLHETSGL